MGFKATETTQAGLEALDGPALQTRQHNTADQIQSVAQTDPSLTNVPAHDAAGNTTQIVVSARGQTFTTLYRYDYNSRLLSATRLRNGPQGESVTTSVTQLEYDGVGLLSRITDNGVVRRLVRDRTDQLARPVLETDGSGNVVRWFVWANGRLLAQVGSNSVIRVPHFDELGRLLAFTDNNGALTDEYAYQPYGRLVGHSGATDTPFAWLGAYGVWYAGNGLYLARHRAYDANLMRFVQADPLGLLGGYNLYLYAQANPIAFLDVLGLEPLMPDLAFAAPRPALWVSSQPSQRQTAVLRPQGPGDYTSPNPAADNLLSGVGAPAYNTMDNTRRAEIAAAPLAAVGGSALVITAPTLVGAGAEAAGEAALHVLARHPWLLPAIPATAGVLEGAFGPPSAEDLPHAVGSMTALIMDEQNREALRRMMESRQQTPQPPRN